MTDDRTLALVTCRRLAGLTRDDEHLADAGRRAGWRIVAVEWDDPVVDWAAFDLAVIRSTWDYHLRPAEFFAWLDRLDEVGASLVNPASTIRWNAHKSYLLELAELGVPIVPTELVPRGSERSLAEISSSRRWPTAVVKPAISATAHGTWVVRKAASEAEARFAAELEERDLLVQPFVPEIETRGELSFVAFEASVSHVVVKEPSPGDFRVQHDFGGSARRVEPARSLVDQANEILGLLPRPAIFARVDAVDVGGRLAVMEVELIEPELFFRLDRSAAARFESALRRYNGGDRSS